LVVCNCLMKELQREYRKFLQHEDLLRAKFRHELAIKQQNEEIKQRQFDENKHIIARYVITLYTGIGRRFYVLELSCCKTLELC